MAPSKRRKADKTQAAQTIAEAIGLLGDYAQTDARLAALRASAEAEIAQIRANVDTLAAPYEARIKALFNQLKPWWAVASDELTDGRRKSVELGGCLIGHRITPPAVKFAKVDEGDIITALIGLGMPELVRTKSEIDKPAVLKAVRFDTDHDLLRGTDEGAKVASVLWNLGALGVTVIQREEFFIDRLPPKEDRVEVVPEPQQVAA